MDLPPLTQARQRLSHSDDMAECEWAILCEHPFKDERHGRLNLRFCGHPGEQVAFAVTIFPPGGEVIEA
jgi:hypothetical protein